MLIIHRGLQCIFGDISLNKYLPRAGYQCLQPACVIERSGAECLGCFNTVVGSLNITVLLIILLYVGLVLKYQLNAAVFMVGGLAGWKLWWRIAGVVFGPWRCTGG